MGVQSSLTYKQMDQLIKIPDHNIYILKSIVKAVSIRTSAYGDSYIFTIQYKNDEQVDYYLKTKTEADAKHELTCFVNSFNH